MNQIPHPELISAATGDGIPYALLVRLASASSTTPPKLLDELACYVATKYATNQMSFQVADSMMNAAFAVSIDEEFFANHDRTIPPALYEVYEAFDAGEYRHPGDADGVDPELKYTRALIERFLKGRKNGA